MFKNIKLWQRIGGGFSLLMAIAIALGALAIVNMNKVETKAVMLQQEYVPELGIANRVERNALGTMHAMRGYSFTAEETYLDEARKKINLLHQGLNDAKELAAKSLHLTELNTAIGTVEDGLSRYEKLMEETIKVNAGMSLDNQQLDAAAQQYMRNCNDFLDRQNKIMAREVESGSSAAKLQERLDKITLVNDIIGLGNDTRVRLFKAQARRIPEAISAAMDNFPLMAKKLSQLRTITYTAENLQQIEATQKAAQNYKTAIDSLVENWMKTVDLSEQRGIAGDEVVAAAASVVLTGMDETTNVADVAVSTLNTSCTVMTWGLGVAVLIGLLIAVLITRSIISPIKQGVKLAEDIGRGDYSVRLNMDRGDEIGTLANALDRMADSLSLNADVAEQIAEGRLNVQVKLASDKDQLGLAFQKMVASLNDSLSQVQVASEQIASGSGQVSDSSQALSQGATESASSLEEISSSLNELASQTTTNAENARQANSLSIEATESARNGSRQMQNMVAAMTEINDAGQNISKIIKTIDEIAFQTNLLALNAAVEAARAGQHGKGFAVVAEEVRNLAARSSKAAEETSQLIEGSVEKTSNGSTIAHQTAAALDEIVNGISKVSDLVGEIAAASNEQAQGVNQINQGVSQIDQVTQQNTASAEESAAAAEELSGQALQLQEMLKKFVLDNRQTTASTQNESVAKSYASRGSWSSQPAPGQPQLAAKQTIQLDDDNFGKY